MEKTVKEIREDLIKSLSKKKEVGRKGRILRRLKWRLFSPNGEWVRSASRKATYYTIKPNYKNPILCIVFAVYSILNFFVCLYDGGIKSFIENIHSEIKFTEDVLVSDEDLED